MSLTLAPGPLSPDPTPGRNFSVEGPAHRILFEPFPRRVRATFAGRTVLDTRRGKLLHETALPPVLYAPIGDLDADLLVDSDHATHCPFKGDASYWTVSVGDAESVDAIWYYAEPIDSARFLTGHAGFYFDRLDTWFDEDERVRGHLRDPYHRVDVRRSSRHVTVSVRGVTVAESRRPMLLSETGLANRFYLPATDVRADLLTSSTKTSVCPYKGEASWWTFTGAGGAVPDVGWSYERPLDDAARVAGHLCFAPAEGVEVVVDGEVQPG